jgi:hypothetical protein
MRPTVPPFRRRPSRRWNLLVAAAAGSYSAWSLVPVWYRAPGGTADGVALPPVSLNAWGGGPTESAALLGIVAVAWVGVRTGRELRRPGRVVAVDVALAVTALLLTTVGILVRPEGVVAEAGPQWGLGLGAVLAGAWTWAAVRALRQAAATNLGHP